MTGRQPWRDEKERHADEGLPYLESVLPHIVLAELFAMVARDDDHSASGPRLGSDEVEELAEIPVGEGHFAVVEIARLRPPVDARVTQILVMGVHEVSPEEKSTRFVGRIAEKSLGKLLGLGRRYVPIRVGVVRDVVDDLPVVETRIEPRSSKVKMRHHTHRVDAGFLQELR